MAKVYTDVQTRIFQIKSWLGLNESPDGDTHLKIGEASKMRNFRITKEGHLQIRPGYATYATLSDGSPVRGLWSGYVGGEEVMMASCGGKLWKVTAGAAAECGEIADEPAHFFGFSNKLYILTGSEYYVWDGENPVSVVEGYVPIVAVSTPPTGGGTLLEDVNKLTGKKRQQFSPDGTEKVFQLAETEIDEVLSVEGTDNPYTVDTEKGAVSFGTAPEKGINSVTITWRKGTGDRATVTGMRFAELYNGSADSRVFLYGDGTNNTIYSGLDNNGMPSAEYFPDLNTMAVGDANTPVTGMIRHYDRLLVFKTDSAYSAIYSTTELADNRVTAAFYVDTLNREVGCAAPGQVMLVNNDAWTLYGNAVYRWSLAYNSTRDERNSQRISDAVTNTLDRFDLSKCIVFDDEYRREFYIICGNEAVVENYGNRAWYYYTDFPATAMVMVGNERYFSTEDGRVMHLSREYRSSDTRDIDAYWESGSMDFDAEWREKHSALLWVSIQPELQARINVSAASNRKSEYATKVVQANVFQFEHVDFNHWSFNTNTNPQVEREKIKVKKATYYKLIFSSVSASSTATILSADIQVRYGGNVK